MEWLILAVASLVAAVPVVVRVRHEYEDPGTLSDPTVAAVWVLYAAIVAAALAAAITSAWSIGLPSWLALPLGCALVSGGFALELGGLAAMASFRRMSGMQPDRLITAGAFRYSRNPQNTGAGILLLGVALLGDSLMAALITAGFWLLFRAYVGYEEDYLKRTFGEEYRRYMWHTPRFLGMPG